MKSRFLIAAVITMLLMCIAVQTAYADTTEEGVYTISGTIDGTVEIPKDVKKVVLDGVNGNETSVLVIPGDAVVTIKDGTKNVLASLQCQGVFKTEGAGDLEIKYGMLLMGADSLFDHKGKLELTDGTIAVVGGELIINDGETIIKDDDDNSSGILQVGGSTILNGGKLSIESKSAGISSQYEFQMYGGSLSINASDGPALRVANGGDGSIVIYETVKSDKQYDIDEMPGENDKTYKTFVDENGEEVKSFSASGEDAVVEQERARNDFSVLLVESAEVAEAAERNEKNPLVSKADKMNGNEPYLIMCIVMLAALGIFIIIIAKAKTKDNTKDKSKKKDGRK